MRLARREDLLARGEVRICAFDIETTKLSLQFPNAEYDQVPVLLPPPSLLVVLSLFTALHLSLYDTWVRIQPNQYMAPTTKLQPDKLNQAVHKHSKVMSKNNSCGVE